MPDKSGRHHSKVRRCFVNGDVRVKADAVLRELGEQTVQH